MRSLSVPCLCPFSVLFKDDCFYEVGVGGEWDLKLTKKRLSRGSEVKYFIKILKWHNVSILNAL